MGRPPLTRSTSPNWVKRKKNKYLNALVAQGVGNGICNLSKFASEQHLSCPFWYVVQNYSHCKTTPIDDLYFQFWIFTNIKPAVCIQLLTLQISQLITWWASNTSEHDHILLLQYVTIYVEILIKISPYVYITPPFFFLKKAQMMKFLITCLIQET